VNRINFKERRGRFRSRLPLSLNEEEVAFSAHKPDTLSHIATRDALAEIRNARRANGTMRLAPGAKLTP
jgi:hypothetical protein